jgi:hypothetical protein
MPPAELDRATAHHYRGADCSIGRVARVDAAINIDRNVGVQK